MTREELRAERHKRGFFLLFGQDQDFDQDFSRQFDDVEEFFLRFSRKDFSWRFAREKFDEDQDFFARTLLLKSGLIFSLIGTWFQQKILKILCGLFARTHKQRFHGLTEFCKNICLLNIEVNCKTFENSTWKNFKTAAEKELPSNVGASLINRSIICYLRFKLTWKLFEGRNNLESASSAKMKKLNDILYRFCFKHIDDLIFTQRAFSTLVDCTS